MKRAAFALALACLAAPAGATTVEVQARQLLDDDLRAWAADPAVAAAIIAQNAANTGLDAAQIEALDQAWRAEIGQATQPTIAPVMTNAASDVLRARIAASGGRVTEAFVMDALGLNVATASATSDYWQGDEAKFSETYPKGAEAMHLGEVEFDESSQSYQMQISFTVTDPASGAPIGAMTVAVDAEQMN